MVPFAALVYQGAMAVITRLVVNFVKRDTSFGVTVYATHLVLKVITMILTSALVMRVLQDVRPALMPHIVILVPMDSTSTSHRLRLESPHAHHVI